MKTLRDRFPSNHQIISVFAVASMLIYGWTLYRVAQKLPSWLLFLNFQEIVFNYAYALVFNFLESLLFTGVILLISLVLPKKFFMDRFVARGALFAILELGYIIYLALAIGQSKASQFPWEVINWAPLIMMVLFALAVLLPGIVLIRKAVDGFADRAIIFLYILVPLSGLAGVVCLINNIF
jgi:hypothetical protein